MRIFIQITLLLSILITNPSQASLIEITNQDTTLNINLSGLNWLHLSHSQNMSRNQIETEILVNGSLYGYRFASTDEAMMLVSSIGPIHDGSEASENFEGMREFFDLFGVPNFFAGGYDNRGQSSWSTIYYGELINGRSDHGFLRLIDSTYATDGSTLNAGLIDIANWQGDVLQATYIQNRKVASMLVRDATDVSEPPTLVILITLLFLLLLRVKVTNIFSLVKMQL